MCIRRLGDEPAAVVRRVVGPPHRSDLAKRNPCLKQRLASAGSIAAAAVIHQALGPPHLEHKAFAFLYWQVGIAEPPELLLRYEISIVGRRKAVGGGAFAGIGQ